MGDVLSAFSDLLTLGNMLIIASGVFFGIVVGVLPGLTVVMGLTIVLPIAFFLKEGGILMMLGIYCGALYGGSVTACLLNIPGTANSAPTVLDGYPLANKHGQPGRALGLSAYASMFGGLFSACALLLTAPALAKIALKFGPAEYFGLMIFGLSIVTSVSGGKNVIKSLLGACIGLLLATVGIDSISGEYRFTFGSAFLGAGLSFIPILVGFYAFAQGLITIEEQFGEKASRLIKTKLKNVLPAFADVKLTFPTVFRSSIIGTLIGVIPGIGGDVACWIAYNEAKRWSKQPEKFGDGAIEGIVAPESANNAITGGALIPLLTLGIPGDAATAIMLGALMMKGIIPGPLLFVQQKVQVFTIIFGLFFANIMMGILAFSGMRLFAKMLSIPKNMMTPMMLIFCFVGTYALNHNMADVSLMIIAGFLGFFILKMGFSIPPIILGMILGRPAEENFRRSYLLYNGDMLIFFKRPISCIFIIIALLSLIYPFVFPYIKRKWHEIKKGSTKNPG